MALDMLARRVVDPDKLITHAFPLDAYREADEMGRNPDDRVGKVVIET